MSIASLRDSDTYPVSKVVSLITSRMINVKSRQKAISDGPTSTNGYETFWIDLNMLTFLIRIRVGIDPLVILEFNTRSIT